MNMNQVQLYENAKFVLQQRSGGRKLTVVIRITDPSSPGPSVESQTWNFPPIKPTKSHVSGFQQGTKLLDLEIKI